MGLFWDILKQLEARRMRNLYIPESLIERLAKRKITYHQFCMWCAIAKAEESGEVTYEKIAEHLGIPVRSAERLVSILEKQGLLMKVRSAKDKRVLKTLIPLPRRTEEHRWIEVPRHVFDHLERWNLKPVQFALWVAVKSLEDEVTQARIGERIGYRHKELLRQHLAELTERGFLEKRDHGRGRAVTYRTVTPDA